MMAAFVILEIPALLFALWGRQRIGLLAWAPTVLLVLGLIAILVVTGG